MISLNVERKINVASIAFGSCQDIPAEEAGDQYDFIPTVAQSPENIISYGITNLGRLPFLRQFERISFSLRYLTHERALLGQRSRSIAPPLYGFGDSMTFLEEAPPAEACWVEAVVNQDRNQKESDYSNNQYLIHLCSSK